MKNVFVTKLLFFIYDDDNIGFYSTKFGFIKTVCVLLFYRLNRFYYHV